MMKTAKRFLANLRLRFYAFILSHPAKVCCNVCGWTGRHFMSDSWHAYTRCPQCGSAVRHRLFLAALQHLDEISFREMLAGKKILHFAPEDILAGLVRQKSARYVSADFLRQGCDLKLDMCNMPEIKDGKFDLLIAFDVLEHVADYKQALVEVYRVLSPNGCAIFTVPQKDGLVQTYENPEVVTMEGRVEHYGHPNHLRIFGDDFASLVGEFGFEVKIVDEKNFSDDIRVRHVLFPPKLSERPFATNYRKVFFCKKVGGDRSFFPLGSNA